MLWVAVDVAVGVLGLVVLGLLGWRLWRQVRVLGRQVSAAGQRIAEATAELERTVPELHRRTDGRP